MAEDYKGMKKTLFTIGRLELSRDFVLFMLAFGILMTILLYSPNEIRNVLVEIRNIGEQILKLGQQNQELAEQGVNNTDKIINDSAMRFNQSSERNIKLINQLSAFVNESESQRQEQTDRLLPIFLRSFNQTDRIDELVQNITERDMEQKIATEEMRDYVINSNLILNKIANATDSMKELIEVQTNISQFLRMNFNESMLAETYGEYANTELMVKQLGDIQKLLNSTDIVSNYDMSLTSQSPP